MLNVEGQNRAIAQLQRAVRSGRLAHTWIFSGPPGVGKFRLAVELARTMLCDAPASRANEGTVPALPADFPLTLPCGACDSCRAIDAGSHPDLHIITKELIRFHDRTGKSKGTTLSIAVIRGEITGDDSPEHRVEPKIYKRSFRGRGKWFVIDEADLMEVPAQNALLKTLEEPPAESFLVMITTSPQELLSTIRSRSQLVSFGELPTEVILKALVGQNVPAADAELLARLARGSLGRALRWAQEIALIEQKNAAAATRKAKRAEAMGEEDEEGTAATVFTPGGILAWTRALGAALDGLVTGQKAASDLVGLLNGFANEYAGLQLARDPLTSKDRAVRDGIALLMGIAADWFSDRLRQGVGAPHAVPLPAATAGLDPTVARELIAAARAAEGEVDMNANVNLLLLATTAEWERALRGA